LTKGVFLRAMKMVGGSMIGMFFGTALGKLVLGFSATLPFAHGLEGHFVFKGQLQMLSTEAESEVLVNLFTPKTRDVMFGPIHSLTTNYEGDNLVQYVATQKVRINNLVFSEATYYESKDFVKIAVGDPETENYFTFIVGTNSISSVETVYGGYKTHWVESTLQQKAL
jgi:hypothetical protein